jgi:hypothetical protein
MDPPPESRLQAAIRGIDAIRQQLAEEGRATWAVYAVRAEQRGGRWLLIIITQRGESTILTNGLAQRLLDVETLYLSGTLEGWIRPLGIEMDKPDSTPICKIEVSLIVRVDDHPSESASLLSAVVDAHDGAVVRLAFAVPEPIRGWPR